MMRTVLRSLLLLTAGSLCVWADPILTLIPSSGLVGGLPGQTVGWGFTITNDTPYFLLVDSSNFCETGGDPQFTDCTTSPFGPSLGTYTDFIANNVTLISPAPPDGSGVLTQTFSLALQHGVGSYTINSGTLTSSQDLGIIFVSFQEYSGNPLNTDNPGTQVSGDIEISANARVQAAVPEPATWALTASFLLAFAVLRRERARG